MGLNQTKICNSTIGKKAAKYYYDNRHQMKFLKTQIEKNLTKICRYGNNKECGSPCSVMTITTINKFKAKLNGTLDIHILLPRNIVVTKDVFVKTFISMGIK